MDSGGTQTHYTLINSADVNTFNVFVSLCANHMLIVTELL